MIRKTTNFQDVMEGNEDVRNTGKDREYLTGKDLSKEVNYHRQKTPQINETEDSFKFMQIDCDYYTTNSNQLPRKFSNLIVIIFAVFFPIKYSLFTIFLQRNIFSLLTIFVFFCVDYLTSDMDDGFLRKNEEYPVIRMFGVTEGGNSVTAHIHQFLPYLYVELAS